MRKIKTLWVYLLLLLVLMVAGCNTSKSPTGNVESETATAYPGVSSNPEVAYPQPGLGNGYSDVSDLQAPTDSHTPEAGKASISGLIYTPTSKTFVQNTVIYLTPAEGDNKDQVPGLLIGSGLSSRGDIVSSTDDKGRFYIDNIPPGNYFLIVSYQNDIIITAVSETDHSPRLFTLDADSSTPLGLVVSPGD